MDIWLEILIVGPCPHYKQYNKKKRVNSSLKIAEKQKTASLEKEFKTIFGDPPEVLFFLNEEFIKEK